jgi:hypothetical protein
MIPKKSSAVILVFDRLGPGPFARALMSVSSLNVESPSSSHVSTLTVRSVLRSSATEKRDEFEVEEREGREGSAKGETEKTLIN